VIDLEYGKALADYQDSVGKYLVYGTNGIIGKTDKFLHQGPGVILGRKGAYRGVHFSFQQFYVIDTAFYVKEKTGQVDMLFLYYFLLTQDINAMDSGSAIPSTDRYEVYELPILLPPLSEQKDVVSILSNLDNKIDLMHRQNKTLEAMTETLFRQWFVEEANDSWNEKTTDDIITVKGGTTPSTNILEYWDGDIYWTSPKDLSSHEAIFMVDTERKITSKGLDQIGSGLLPVGSVLLSSRAPIGYLAITDIPVAINQGYIGIVCEKGVSNWFAYLWCKENMELIKNSGNGSVFQEISKSTFKTLSVQIPEGNILNEFDAIVKPYFDRVRCNQQQIRTLEKLRDGLLPRLMSGKIKMMQTNEGAF
jgi:type I restriction enzyme S subunit